MSERTMASRGELWTVAGGVYASKPRPALIIQDDRYSGTASVTVLPLTTTEADAPLLRFPIQPTPANGLERRSWVMVDKPTTVRRTSLHVRVGRLPAAQVADIERLLVVFLGLG